MNSSPSQKIRIALFTVLGLGVFAAAIYFIGIRKSLFGSTFSTYSMFNNVGGLQVGNNVRYAGINIGVVEDIQITSDSSVKVSYRINENVRRFLRKDAVSSIGSDGLMGDKLVNISPGTVSSGPLANGDRIAAQMPLDYDKIVTKLARVADNADSITFALSGIVGQISKGKGSVGRLLYSDKLAKELEGTVSSAQKTIKSVDKSSQGFTQNMSALKNNFLLRGYFKKQAKKKQESRDSARAARDSARTKRRNARQNK